MANVVECLDSARFRIPVETRIKYRQTLARRSSAIRRGRVLIAESPQSVCTVVFEIIDTGNSRYYIYELVPRSLSMLEQHRDLRTAFDHVYPCGPGDCPVHIILNTSHSFRPIPILSMLNYDPAQTANRSRIYAHTVRVIPVSRRNPPLLELPSEVIRHIVKLALADKSTGWRKKLLTYGLVCTSWEHVLDLALGGFEDVIEYDYPGVIPVARVLDARPERAAAIRTFDPSAFDYNIPQTGSIGNEKWEAILTILFYATSVKTVRLTNVNPPFVPRFLALLKELRQVRVCVMKFPSPKNKIFRGTNLTMTDVQTAIAEWEHLETLELANLYREDVHTLHPPPQLKFNVRKLALQFAALRGPQLMPFATTPAPRLTELNLLDVQELLNRDLLAFLDALAQTLSHLIVLRCNFVRAEDEEHAIDAVMPIMTSLVHLSTDGYCASILALSRKTNAPMDAINCHISLRPANPGVTLADAAEVIAAVTGWSTVSLFWTQGWDETLVASIKREAKQRGVTLNCGVLRIGGK
ncbi:hypothetical protein C0991_000350 [Blastosporella zonata]|nr:hypothetical protein C0991_000350 [Blastosporella zonata]